MRAQVNGCVIFQIPAVRNRSATATAAATLIKRFQVGTDSVILSNHGPHRDGSARRAAVDRGGARADRREEYRENDAWLADRGMGPGPAKRHQERRAQRR